MEVVMKEITGYLLDRETGVGISGKAVAFTNLAGAAFASGASPYISLDAVTDGDGRFRGRFELSPGPVNVEVTVSGTEVKGRKWDEKAQFGYSWASDQRLLARAFKRGVISGYLNELAVSVPSGHIVRVATGAAVFNGNVLSIENGNYDIAGTANTNPALNPRLDLVTLRQYNEDASGQDAGRQDIVITLGTSQNVAPATPTGASFVDEPLAVLSTAYNAATTTVSDDLREFTGISDTATPLSDYYTTSDSASVTTSYTTFDTLTITGLDDRKVYDGQIVIFGHFGGDDLKQASVYNLDLRLNSDFMLGGVKEFVPTGISFNPEGSSNDYLLKTVLSFSWPIIAVTGVTSFSLPIELRSTPLADGAVVFMYNLYAYMTLKERR
jgi:hypothetical protein